MTTHDMLVAERRALCNALDQLMAPDDPWHREWDLPGLVMCCEVVGRARLLQVPVPAALRLRFPAEAGPLLWLDLDAALTAHVECVDLEGAQGRLLCALLVLGLGTLLGGDDPGVRRLHKRLAHLPPLPQESEEEDEEAGAAWRTLPPAPALPPAVHAAIRSALRGA